MVEQSAFPNERESSLAELATILRQNGAHEVYVFGSAARAEDGPESDWDFAVVGLPPERFFPALAKLMSASRRRIDLIDLDEDSPFVRHLRQEGKLRRVG